MRSSAALSIVSLALLHGLSLAGILGMSVYDPSREEEVRAVSFDQGGESDPAARRFEKQDEGDSWKVLYRFEDGDEIPQEITCRIRKQHYEREAASFGYAKDKMWAELNRKLEQEIKQEALRLGVTDDFSIEVSKQLDPDVRQVERDPLDRGSSPERIREFREWLKGLKKRQQDLLADYYRQHGFRLEGKTLLVDYQGIAVRATPALQDCFRALNTVLTDPKHEKQRSELFLRFFQQVRYEIPESIDRRGRQTHGFRVPAAVMADGSGDCDSKAAALTALWRNYPKQVLVLLRDGAKHALVALEETPNNPDVQRIGNHYYRVGEVVAKENLPPEILENKDKELWYTCIRPVGQSAKVSCP